MARVLHVLHDPPGPCAYLDHAEASLEHHVMLDVTPAEFERLLSRGIRRFGPDYFRPRCPACSECVPTRVPFDSFERSRSQSRVWKRGQRYRQEFGVPIIDGERLALYQKWHKAREKVRGWEESALTEKAYAFQFAFPHPAARELTLYDGDRLVGVSLCDETPAALSAIYFFYDPELSKDSLGTLNVLRLLELGKTLAKMHLYLGFRVRDCVSLRYKSSFLPQEILRALPEDHEEPLWETISAPA